MFIPYSTDAPIYHWPFATGGLLAACIGASALLWANPEMEAVFILQHDAIRPVQWVLSVLAHASIFHLLANAFGLWAFGLIVEGKVGWWRALLLFFGIGILQSATEQIVIVMSGGGNGGSLGASAAIYGLMAVALIWAPVNNLSCVVFLRFRVFTFELPVAAFVGIYVLLDLVIVSLSGFALSSSLLHLAGAIAGLALGCLWLFWGWVDCERWDVFSVLSGKHRVSTDDSLGAWKEEEALRSTPEERHRRREDALHQIRQILEAGNAALAWQAHRRMKKEDREWQLPSREFLQILEGHRKQASAGDSLEMMREFIRTYPDQAHVVRLLAAHVLLQNENRPGQARKVLRGVNPLRLTAAQQRTHQKLLRQAEDQSAEDPYEVVDENWG